MPKLDDKILVQSSEVSKNEMTIRFTPCPWKIKHNCIVWTGNGTKERLIVPEGDKLERDYFLSLLSTEERQANVQLISTAPELYEALQEMIDFQQKTFSDFAAFFNARTKILEKAKQAIAKAEGREPDA